MDTQRIKELLDNSDTYIETWIELLFCCWHHLGVLNIRDGQFLQLNKKRTSISVKNGTYWHNIRFLEIRCPRITNISAYIIAK